MRTTVSKAAYRRGFGLTGLAMKEVGASRRQLSLYASGDGAARLEAVRQRVDPLQHALIPAHVTLCREDEIAPWSAAELQARCAGWRQGQIELRFGAAEASFGHGLLLNCIGGQAAFHDLRAQLLGAANVAPIAAHVTLAHPRNPKAVGNAPEAAAGLPRPLTLRFDRVHLIEQHGAGPWRTLGVFPFARVEAAVQPRPT